MTVNSPNFQLNKLRRIINTQGQDFVFTRETLDEFKEPTGEVQEFLIKGIYHEHYENLFLRQSTTDATVVRSKPSPKITCGCFSLEKYRYCGCQWTDNENRGYQERGRSRRGCGYITRGD